LFALFADILFSAVETKGGGSKVRIQARIRCEHCGTISDGTSKMIGKTQIEICGRCMIQLKEWFLEVLDS
jgi:hypothetical protein